MNLYKFSDGSKFTTAKAIVKIGEDVYMPRTMSRSRYVLDTLVKKNNIAIEFAGDDSFARNYLHTTTDKLTVSIALMNGVIFYRGNLITARYDKNKIILTFQQLVRLGSDYSGERRIYQRNCPYELYGRNCGATKKYHTLEFVNQVSKKIIAVRYDTGNPDNDNRGDEVFNVLPTIYDDTIKASVVNLIGGLIQSLGFNYWITKLITPVATGQYVDFSLELFSEFLHEQPTVFASLGCLRTTSDCSALHGNIDNYGGFPGLTKLSPFSGGLRGN